jgi:hypothetical protein
MTRIPDTGVIAIEIPGQGRKGSGDEESPMRLVLFEPDGNETVERVFDIDYPETDWEELLDDSSKLMRFVFDSVSAYLKEAGIEVEPALRRFALFP